MKTKKINFRSIFFLLVLIYSAELTAQNNRDQTESEKHKNTITLLLGYHFTQTQDVVYSPMIYNGSSANAVGLNYQRFTKKGFHHFAFNFENIEVTATELISSPVFSRVPSEALQASIQYGFVHKWKSTEKINFYAGGLLQAKYQNTTYNFGFNDEESYYYENSINPWAIMDYQLNTKNQIRTSLSFPLLAFITRPDYAIVDNRDIQGEDGIDYLYKKGEFSSWENFQAVDFSIGITRHLSPSIDLLAVYKIKYFRYKKPEPIAVLNNSIDIGLTFNF